MPLDLLLEPIVPRKPQLRASEANAFAKAAATTPAATAVAATPLPPAAAPPAAAAPAVTAATPAAVLRIARPPIYFAPPPASDASIKPWAAFAKPLLVPKLHPSAVPSGWTEQSDPQSGENYFVRSSTATYAGPVGGTAAVATAAAAEGDDATGAAAVAATTADAAERTWRVPARSGVAHVDGRDLTRATACTSAARRDAANDFAEERRAQRAKDVEAAARRERVIESLKRELVAPRPQKATPKKEPESRRDRVRRANARRRAAAGVVGKFASATKLEAIKLEAAAKLLQALQRGRKSRGQPEGAEIQRRVDALRERAAARRAAAAAADEAAAFGMGEIELAPTGVGWSAWPASADAAGPVAAFAPSGTPMHWHAVERTQAAWAASADPAAAAKPTPPPPLAGWSVQPDSKQADGVTVWVSAQWLPPRA